MACRLESFKVPPLGLEHPPEHLLDLGRRTDRGGQRVEHQAQHGLLAVALDARLGHEFVDGHVDFFTNGAALDLQWKSGSGQNEFPFNVDLK